MLVNKKEIILKEKKEMKIKGVKLNISAIAKDYGVCWSTAKKMALCKTERKKREFKGELKLLKYQEIRKLSMLSNINLWVYKREMI